MLLVLSSEEEQAASSARAAKAPINLIFMLVCPWKRRLRKENSLESVYAGKVPEAPRGID